MNVYIYNPNSRGGNYEYAIRLANAYAAHQLVQNVILLLPRNASHDSNTVHKILLSDVPPFSNKFLSRLYFLYRSVINPFVFFVFLLKRKGYVIFNDYDQLTAFFWAPLMKLLKRRMVFSVILHDPDRDSYFSSKKVSEITMEKVMSVMDIGFYHEGLPQKKYYTSDVNYVAVPHGIFALTQQYCDNNFISGITAFKNGSVLLGALGNVRKEKNYEMAIRVLSSVSGVKLLIAGLPANTSVSLQDLQHLVDDLRLNDRVLIIERYLDEGDLQAAANICDAFMLYYSSTFKSQSGLLNMLAPLQKPLLVSDNDSALSRLVKKYKLGLMAAADSSEALSQMLREFLKSGPPKADWNGYLKYASWDNHVSLALDAFRKIK